MYTYYHDDEIEFIVFLFEVRVSVVYFDYLSKKAKTLDLPRGCATPLLVLPR